MASDPPVGPAEDPHFFRDFTEENYRRLLALAGDRFAFARFRDPLAEGQVRWRHDVDVSLHRARRLGELEAEAGAVATYFLHPQCRYYNLHTVEAREIVAALRAQGHDVGLHYDPSEHPHLRTWDDHAAQVRWERDMLTHLFGAEPVAVSFHCFGDLEDKPPGTRELEGMVNAYGDELQAAATYVSDSNGVWRFRRIEDVLTDPAVTSAQVLTHPVFWTPEVLAPRVRIQRAIDGAAMAMGRYYDRIVEATGRPNLWE